MRKPSAGCVRTVVLTSLYCITF